MISDVAALFVDSKGPYPKIVEHWYDEARDACTYAGPWPVVVHPPCGPWGHLRHLCKRQHEAPLAPLAVQFVRRFGGVLEHPAHSKLWDWCPLPRPGEAPDRFGGRTFEVNQCDFGHVARKRTWLYVVGVDELGPLPPPREPTHWVSGSRTAKRGPVPPGIKVCSARQRRRTPPEFALWLVNLARRTAQERKVAS
jgi:hypothetical protein